MTTKVASENEFAKLLLAEVAAPTTPASGLIVAYAKSDGRFYYKDDAGTEHQLAHVSELGGSAALQDLTDVSPTATDDAITGDVLTFDGAEWAPAAPTGGGSGLLEPPDVIQAAMGAGAAATSITITAAASGNALILFTNSSGGQVTSPTCTNVTWTQVKTHSSAGGFMAIWVGIVAGGSSGTSITMTKPGAFNSTCVIEVAETLTPTAGGSDSVNTGATATTGAGTVNFRRKSGLTSGRFVVMGAGQDSTDSLMRLQPRTPMVGLLNSAAVVLAAGYVPSDGIVAAEVLSKVGALLITEVT